MKILFVELVNQVWLIKIIPAFNFVISRKYKRKHFRKWKKLLIKFFFQVKNLFLKELIIIIIWFTWKLKWPMGLNIFYLPKSTILNEWERIWINTTWRENKHLNWNRVESVNVCWLGFFFMNSLPIFELKQKKLYNNIMLYSNKAWENGE